VGVKPALQEIDAETQIFTPAYVAHFLAQNSIGRLWLHHRPTSSLRERMGLYVAGQDCDDDLPTITSPEDIRVLDPACGTGNLLAVAFDLLTDIYLEAGYKKSAIPRLILTKNLFGVNGQPSVASQISGALAQLKAGLGGYTNSVTFNAVPVLFNNGYHNPPEEFLAVTSNLANCLVVEPTKIYYPDPGNETFREVFRNMVHQSKFTVTATAVDVWVDYHCKCGEIHCGTAAVRSIPATPPWWERDVIKKEWKDEK
jgi:SAM-dependent methyltransferase